VGRPWGTIGIIGGGQLGMMTAREAHRMGFRSVVLDPDINCSASRVADEIIASRFDDVKAAEQLARSCDVITYEFEHIDAGAVELIADKKNVFPKSSVLRTAQNRQTEKAWLQRHGFPTADFGIAHDGQSLRSIAQEVGLPVVVKTTLTGYDGKGQSILRSESELRRFVESFVPSETVVEKFLELEAELSVIVAREQNGRSWVFPIALNAHRNNILHTSIAPAPVADDLLRRAHEIGKSVCERLGVVGLLCVELFLTTGGELLVNELAPRPHNSGHWSLDGCSMSQFEALVRTITGLPMRAPEVLQPTAIVNLLGKHVERLDQAALCRIDGTRLHLYGKMRIEPNRKMGHVSVVRKSIESLLEGVNAIEQCIGETVSDFTQFEWGVVNV
jgi:5-(carboxyamino)imidazole ribonucleotide synthase